MIRQTESTLPVEDTRTGHPLGAHYAALVRRIQGGPGAAGFCVGVTSCSRREGVSTVASNLAIAATRSGTGAVLLIDANPTHSTLARRFGIQADRGLVELLGGLANENDVVQKTDVERLMLLGPGRSSDVPRSFHGLADRLDAWRKQYELIVMDLPVADELSPCTSLAALLDGILLVVEAERTNRDAVRRAKVRLERSQARLLGVVLNKGRL